MHLCLYTQYWWLQAAASTPLVDREKDSQNGSDSAHASKKREAKRKLMDFFREELSAEPMPNSPFFRGIFITEESVICFTVYSSTTSKGYSLSGNLHALCS